MPLEHPTDGHVGERQHRRHRDERRHQQRLDRVVVGLVPRVVERSRPVGDVEHDGDPVRLERRPAPVEVGVGQRPAVDRADRDHRRRDAAGGQRRQLTIEPSGVTQRDVSDGVQPPCTGGAHAADRPPVPGPHVGQLGRRPVLERPDPEQPEVGEHDRLVDALLVHLRQPSHRVAVVDRDGIVVADVGWEAPALALAAGAHRHDVARRVRLGQVDAPPVGRSQPGVAEVVVLDPHSQVPFTAIEVVGPEGAGLEEVRVGVDHAGHTAAPYN